MPSNPPDTLATEIACERLLPVLQFIQLRLAGLSVRSAADCLALPAATIWRRAVRFLACGVAGLLPGRREIGRSDTTLPEFTNPRTKERLGPVLQYLIQESAAGASQRAVHELCRRLLRYGLAGLERNYRAREHWKRELREFEVTDEILDAVERIAGKCENVGEAWKRYGRSPQCPFRLAVRLGKKQPVPQSFLRAVRLQPIKARAWIGGTGRIYLNLAGKNLTVERPNANAANKT